MEREFVWQTTQGGPLAPSPEAPVSQVCSVLGTPDGAA